MADSNAPRYGTPNWEMLKGWFEMTPEDDGPFWALNLMKYREVADYGDEVSDAPVRSGKAADDAYAPLGPLAAIGAAVAYHGDVVEQLAGGPAWDRIGIVRYPTRAAFFAMQQRDDFKSQHKHKDAGMEFTIVMSTLPVAPAFGERVDVAPADGRLVLSVVRDADGTTGADEAVAAIAGVTPVASFSVEGVIVGDERSFTRSRFDRVADDEALAALVALAGQAEEAHVVVLDTQIDNILDTIATAPTAGA